MKKPDPSTPSQAYLAMAPIWEKVETVLGGTKAMRAAGRTYLPQHQEETDTAYAERLECSTLLNQSRITLESWVGRPFGQPVKRGADLDKKVEGWLEDIDLQGNQVTVFARNWFREGLAKAFAHVLVDFPYVGNEPRSLADDRRENLRPYWTFIRPENLIFSTATTVNGREVLTHARIIEQVIGRDGWEEKATTRIRVFDRYFPGESKYPGVYFSLWELLKDKGRERWVEAQPPVLLTIDEIPIVTFYADRSALMLGNPPIEDLVDLNIAHWQSSSDQRSILTVARFPILAASGIDDEDGPEGATKKKVPLGPRKVLTTPEPSGKWYYVEHQGNAIAAGRQDLQDLEEKMAHWGAEFLAKRPGSTTATARALDSAEATSPLMDAVVRFNDALNQAVVLTGKWVKNDKPGTLSLSADFNTLSVDQADFAALTAARTARDISRRTYLHELRRRGTLGEDFDPEEDLEELKGEEMLGTPPPEPAGAGKAEAE